MTEAEAIEAIHQRWIDAWVPLQPAVPFTFTNERLEAVAAWARVTVMLTTRVQSTSGTDGQRKFDNRGVIFVQLFGAIDVGDKPLALLAGDVRSVLEARRIGTDVITYAGASRPAGADGAWAMRTVTVPFQFDETR